MHKLKNLLPYFAGKTTRTRIADVIYISKQLVLSPLFSADKPSIDSHNTYMLNSGSYVVNPEDYTRNTGIFTSDTKHSFKNYSLKDSRDKCLTDIIDVVENTAKTVHVDNITESSLQPIEKQQLFNLEHKDLSVLNDMDRIIKHVKHLESRRLRVLKNAKDASSSFTDSTWNAVHQDSKQMHDSPMQSSGFVVAFEILQSYFPWSSSIIHNFFPSIHRSMSVVKAIEKADSLRYYYTQPTPENSCQKDIQKSEDKDKESTQSKSLDSNDLPSDQCVKSAGFFIPSKTLISYCRLAYKAYKIFPLNNESIQMLENLSYSIEHFYKHPNAYKVIPFAIKDVDFGVFNQIKILENLSYEIEKFYKHPNALEVINSAIKNVDFTDINQNDPLDFYPMPSDQLDKSAGFTKSYKALYSHCKKVISLAYKIQNLDNESIRLLEDFSNSIEKHYDELNELRRISRRLQNVNFEDNNQIEQVNSNETPSDQGVKSAGFFIPYKTLQSYCKKAISLSYKAYMKLPFNRDMKLLLETKKDLDEIRSSLRDLLIDFVTSSNNEQETLHSFEPHMFLTMYENLKTLDNLSNSIEKNFKNFTISIKTYMKAPFNRDIKLLTETKKDLNTIKDSLSELLLNLLISSNNKQRTLQSFERPMFSTMNENLQMLDNLSNSIEMLDSISNSIEMLDSISNSIEENLNDSSESIEKSLDDLGESLDNSFEDLSESINKSFNDLGESMEKSLDDLGESLDKSFEGLSESIEKSFEGLSESIEKSFEGLSESTESNFTLKNVDCDHHNPYKENYYPNEIFKEFLYSNSESFPYNPILDSKIKTITQCVEELLKAKNSTSVAQLDVKEISYHFITIALTIDKVYTKTNEVYVSTSELDHILNDTQKTKIIEHSTKYMHDENSISLSTIEDTNSLRSVIASNMVNYFPESYQVIDNSGLSDVLMESLQEWSRGITSIRELSTKSGNTAVFCSAPKMIHCLSTVLMKQTDIARDETPQTHLHSNDNNTQKVDYDNTVGESSIKVKEFSMTT